VNWFIPVPMSSPQRKPLVTEPMPRFVELVVMLVAICVTVVRFVPELQVHALASPAAVRTSTAAAAMTASFITGFPRDLGM
jgi:hypothetical protein